jgi:hypothetical protein
MASIAATPLSDPYRLVSVRAAPTPVGAVGSSWHRYEICQGFNRIVGYRQGATDSVTTAIEALVAQLNERRLYQRGRVHIALGPTSRVTDAEGAKRGGGMGT